MRNDIPTQRNRGISKRAYHKALVAHDAPKVEWRPPARSTRQRKRNAWLSKAQACTSARGREELVGDVLLTKASNCPPDYWAENENLVKCVLRKRSSLFGRGWDVLLPGGGVHEFKTKRKAVEFISQLAPVEEPEGVEL